MSKLKWNKPSQVPKIMTGTEELFWVAVQSKYSEEPKVFLAFYQDRPLEEDNDDCLINVDGEAISSIGWVDCKEHCDFADYYTPLGFDNDYVLLGWAEYVPPLFTID